MNDEVCFWHADKHLKSSTSSYYHFGCLQPGISKLPKISLHIFAISSEEHGGEVDFLSTDKCKNFLQVDSITLGLHSQACPKYPKH